MKKLGPEIMKNHTHKLKVHTIIKLSNGEEVKTSFSKESISEYLAFRTKLIFINHRYFNTGDIVELIPATDEEYIEVKYGEGMFASNEVRKRVFEVVA
jgi:hypothetical protein